MLNVIDETTWAVTSSASIGWSSLLNLTDIAEMVARPVKCFAALTSEVRKTYSLNRNAKK